MRGHTEILCFWNEKKNAVYLVDNFVLFYYMFMAGGQTEEHFGTNRISTPAVNAWCGLAFERTCLLHITEIKQKLGISGVSTDVNSWYCRKDPDRGIFGSQIDLLIVRKDQVINMCEMKYSGTEYSLSTEDDETIRRHGHDLVTSAGTKYAIFPTLITTYGLVENSYSGSIQSVITMDDLFAPC